MIARCKKIATARNSGDTPLHKVCRTGKYVREVVCVMKPRGWTKGTSLWKKDTLSLNELALHIAIIKIIDILQEMARYLILVEGASVNAQDNAGWTPLHEACCNRSTQLAGLLLGAGADVNISATDGTRSASYLSLPPLPPLFPLLSPSLPLPSSSSTPLSPSLSLPL